MKVDFPYTYLYLRKDGTPYYVGKGRGKRAFAKTHGVSVPVRARIVLQHWASDAEALEMEQWWIRFFGRKDIGTGILRNLTDGGEATPNLTPAAKERQVAGFRRWVNSPANKQHLERLRTKEHQAMAARNNPLSHSSEHQRAAGFASGNRKIETGFMPVLNHTRWHVRRGIVKKGCPLCQSPTFSIN